MRFHITVLRGYAITFIFFIISFFFGAPSKPKTVFPSLRLKILGLAIRLSFESLFSASYHKFSLFITNFR